MAKIKLRLSKKDDENPSNDSITTSPSTSTTIKLKQPKTSGKTTKKTESSSSSTGFLPKIKLKTSSPTIAPSSDNTFAKKSLKTTNNITSNSIPTIKFKTLDQSFNQGGNNDIDNNNNNNNNVRKNKKKTPTIKVKPVKLPGNGYDSEDPDKEDDPLIEEGIIIRFLPDENLNIVRSAVENSERGDKHNKDIDDIDLSNISIVWKDKRRAIVYIEDSMYAGKLINLPTISEIHKTIDKKNIFKTIDISQMLLIVKKIYNENEIFNLKIDKEFGETLPDGLTPPMEFSKQSFTKKYENSIIQNVEDEVNRLLKLDEEAESSVFEFIDTEEEKIIPMSVMEAKAKNKRLKKEKKRLRKERERLQMASNNNDSIGISINTNTNTNNDDEMDIDDQFEDIDNELDKLMDESLNDIDEDNNNNNTKHDNNNNHNHNNEDDDDDEDDDEDDEEDEEEEEDEIENDDGQQTNNTTKHSEDEDDEDDDDDDDEDDEDDEKSEAVRQSIRNGGVNTDEPSQHNALIYEEIFELESTISQKEKDLIKAINPIMKNRINDVISRLKQELEMKKSLIITEDGDGDQAENENENENADEEEDDEANDHNDEANEEEEEEDVEDDEGEDIEEDNNKNDKDKNNQSQNEDEDEDDYDDLF